MPKSHGFTLIELLVTISIISVLAAIGLVAYSSVLKQGRDSKRQSDLRSIQSALEQYYSDQGFYPNSNFGLALFSGSVFTNATGNPANPPVTKTYMNALPKDPKAPAFYLYNVLLAGYCLYANLENSSPGKPAVCTNTAYNFAVIPP